MFVCIPIYVARVALACIDWRRQMVRSLLGGRGGGQLVAEEPSPTEMSDSTLVFEMEDKLGEGSFGSVWRATDKRNTEIVTIKFLKDHITSWEQCMNMIEIKSLMNLGRHPNIVHLKEVFMENKNAYLIFENMDCSLLHLMNRRCPRVFQEKEV
ncbi:hypothetical protein Syun_007654 [Stephania yunnanensis]|uniref:Protein kinase domain-containing protein n=1 Tax=Stephania yunnanensis TaxID=152371 RepID=A0AAP0L0C2_9MAGN